MGPNCYSGVSGKTYSSNWIFFLIKKEINK